MKYQEYREFKESLPLDDLLRLDCMNPFKAMAYLKPISKKSTKENSLKYIEELIAYTGNITFTKGVRDALKTLFYKFQSQTIYIPNEVYPVYFDLARDLDVIPYSIFNNSIFSQIKNSTILYTFNHFGSLDIDYDVVKAWIDNGMLSAMESLDK